MARIVAFASCSLLALPAAGLRKTTKRGQAQVMDSHRHEPNSSTSDRWAQAVMPCLQGIAVMTTESMTVADYDAAYDSVASRYNTLPIECNATFCPQADWSGCVLRAAGHDFMDFEGGRFGTIGGSDGCLDLHDEENNGLHECLYEGEFGVSILQAYQEHCTTVSLADFLVIAGESVMHLARQHVVEADPSKMSLDFKTDFMYGRTTAETCPWAVGRLVDGEESCTAVEEAFGTRMGLSWRETAALMGVHTLGRAEVRHSGYDGFWSDPNNSRLFNNDYYTSILDKGWMAERVAGNPLKNQWFRSDDGGRGVAHKEMMLNTDMCLAYTNAKGQDLNAGEELSDNSDGCCAWRFSSDAKFDQYTNNYFVKGEDFCGSVDYPTNVGATRTQMRMCCGGMVRDCGTPQTLAGPAFYDVKDFALSEESWLQEFGHAWRKATGNGARDLKRLS